MKTTMTKSVIGICAGIAMLAMFVPCAAETRRNNSNYEPGQDPNKTNSTITIPAQPIIIWFHTVGKDPNILRIALSGGVFTHVMLSGVHYDDIPDYFSRRDCDFQELLKICKQANIKIIWNRWAWPGYNFKNFTWDDIFNPAYYAKQIRHIKKEARQIGAHFTCLDFEPYGKSLVKPLRIGNMPEKEYSQLTQAVETAVEQVGQVDYIMPAAYPYPYFTRFERDMYRPLQKLGKLSIAEHTYYNNPAYFHYPDNTFDVFGAYCRKDPNNLGVPSCPYFTPREILERQDLWKHKKGLFIYPGEGKNALETALEFSKIRRLRPKRDR